MSLLCTTGLQRLVQGPDRLLNRTQIGYSNIFIHFECSHGHCIHEELPYYREYLKPGLNAKARLHWTPCESENNGLFVVLKHLPIQIHWLRRSHLQRSQFNCIRHKDMFGHIQNVRNQTYPYWPQNGFRIHVIISYPITPCSVVGPTAVESLSSVQCPHSFRTLSTRTVERDLERFEFQIFPP